MGEMKIPPPTLVGFVVDPDRSGCRIAYDAPDINPQEEFLGLDGSGCKRRK